LMRRVYDAQKGCDSQVLKPMSQSMHQNDTEGQLGIYGF